MKSGWWTTCLTTLLCIGTVSPARAQKVALSIAANKSAFEVGEKFTLSAKVYGNDPQDIPESQFSWSIKNESGWPFVQLLDTQEKAAKDNETVPGSQIIVKGEKAGQATILLTRKMGDAANQTETAEFKVEVKPLQTFRLEPTPPEKMLVGQRFTFTILAQTKDLKNVDVKDSRVESSDVSKMSLSVDPGQPADPQALANQPFLENRRTGSNPEKLIAQAVGVGRVKLRLSGENKTSSEYEIEIEAPALTFKPETVEMLEGEEKVVQYSLPSTVQSDQVAVTWPNSPDGKITATPEGNSVKLKAGENVVTKPETIEVVAVGTSNGVEVFRQKLPVLIKPRVEGIELDNPGTLLLDQVKTLGVHFYSDERGTDISEARDFRFKSSPAGLLSVKKSNDGRGLVVRGLKTGSASITIDAGDEKKTTVSLEVTSISDFRELDVHFTPVPYLQARDLYGKGVAKAFIVVRLSLLNNLRNEVTGAPINRSLLVFADTIRGSVILEKSFDPKQGSADLLGASPIYSFESRRINSTYFNGGDPDTDESRTNESGARRRDAKWSLLSASDYWQFFGGPEAGDSTSSEVPHSTLNSELPRPVDGIFQVAITPQNLTLREGERKRLLGTVFKDGEPYSIVNPDGSKTPVIVEWSSSDDTIATVDANGVVTGRIGAYKVARRGAGALGDAADPTDAQAPLAGQCTITATYYHIDGTALAKDERTIYVVADHRPQQFLFSPFTFDLITGGTPKRENRASRTRLFNFMRAAGTFGSFLSNLNVLRGSGTKILEQYSNVLIPGAQEFIPDMGDTQRQNLLRDIMRPVEQVAPGGTLGKVVLFPRQPVTGFMPGYAVRMAGVNVRGLTVDLAVVERLGTARNDQLVIDQSGND